MSKVKVKTVLLGDSGVGKTSIAVRLAKDEFNDRAQPTVGAAFFTFTAQGQDGGAVQFEMWDTAGQERYRSLAPMYYRGAEVVVLVFALDDRHSFEAGHRWLQDVCSAGTDSCTLVLVGNKCDLEGRAVTTEEAEAFAQEQGMIYIETSARTAHNVRRIMETVAERLPDGVGTRELTEDQRRAERQANRVRPAAGEPAGGKSGCC